MSKRSDSVKKFTAAAIKASSKEQLKAVEAAGDLVGNKIADKITSVSKKYLLKNYQMKKQKQM